MTKLGESKNKSDFTEEQKYELGLKGFGGSE
jgi:hypothetical protein